MTAGDVVSFRTSWHAGGFLYRSDRYELKLEGGDCVDADGIPLNTMTHRQKAGFLNQMRSIVLRNNLLRIERLLIQGVPGNSMVPW
jgi:hypothetical protein